MREGEGGETLTACVQSASLINTHDLGEAQQAFSTKHSRTLLALPMRHIPHQLKTSVLEGWGGEGGNWLSFRAAPSTLNITDSFINISEFVYVKK